MAMPQFSMQDLIEAGVHFGHKKHRWNPKMAPYIFGVRNDVHIIDLQQTVPLLNQALNVAREVASNNGRILFVGTKRQASDIIADAAERCGQYYINQRWLGGMLTNWSTIQNSIRKLRTLEEKATQENLNLTKKERLQMDREREKLEKSLGGIKNMAGLPDLIFLIDTNRENLAIAEAKRLGIPVIAVLDSNSDIENITYPVPGNDDASKAIRLYCNLIADAALEGLQRSIEASEGDAGEAETVPAAETKVPAEKPAEESADSSKEPTVVVKKTAKKKASGKDEAADETAGDAKAETADDKEEAKTEAKKAQAS